MNEINITRKCSPSFLKNKKLLECRQAFTLTNNMALSGLWENVILTKINTYHRWFHGYVKRRYLVQKSGVPIGGVLGPIPTKC